MDSPGGIDSPLMVYSFDLEEVERATGIYRGAPISIRGAQPVRDPRLWPATRCSLHYDPVTELLWVGGYYPSGGAAGEPWFDEICEEADITMPHAGLPEGGKCYSAHQQRIVEEPGCSYQYECKRTDMNIPRLTNFVHPDLGSVTTYAHTFDGQPKLVRETDGWELNLHESDILEKWEWTDLDHWPDGSPNLYDQCSRIEIGPEASANGVEQNPSVENTCYVNGGTRIKLWQQARSAGLAVSGFAFAYASLNREPPTSMDSGDRRTEEITSSSFNPDEMARFFGAAPVAQEARDFLRQEGSYDDDVDFDGKLNLRLPHDGIELGPDATSFTFYNDLFGDKYAVVTLCFLAQIGQPSNQPCSLEFHSVAKARELGTAAACIDVTLCDRWVMRLKEAESSGSSLIPDWANDLKDTVSGALGAVGTLLAGVGPPWALGVLQKVLQGDFMAAMEVMLDGLGVPLDFSPGGIGFVSYNVLTKLLSEDIGGARADVEAAVVAEVDAQQGPVVAAVVRQLLDAEPAEWICIIRDSVVSSLTDGILREAILTSEATKGISPIITERLIATLKAILFASKEVIILELENTIISIFHMAKAFTDEKDAPIFIKALIQILVELAENHRETAEVLVQKVSDVILRIISGTWEYAGTILASVVHAYTGQADIADVLDVWLGLAMKKFLPSDKAPAAKLLLEAAGVTEINLHDAEIIALVFGPRSTVVFDEYCEEMDIVTPYQGSPESVEDAAHTWWQAGSHNWNAMDYAGEPQGGKCYQAHQARIVEEADNGGYCDYQMECYEKLNRFETWNKPDGYYWVCQRAHIYYEDPDYPPSEWSDNDYLRYWRPDKLDECYPKQLQTYEAMEEKLKTYTGCSTPDDRGCTAPESSKEMAKVALGLALGQNFEGAADYVVQALLETVPESHRTASPAVDHILDMLKALKRETPLSFLSSLVALVTEGGAVDGARLAIRVLLAGSNDLSKEPFVLALASLVMDAFDGTRVYGEEARVELETGDTVNSYYSLNDPNSTAYRVNAALGFSSAQGLIHDRGLAIDLLVDEVTDDPLRAQLLRTLALGGVAVRWIETLVEILRADIPNIPDRLARVVTHVVAQLPAQPDPASTMPEQDELLKVLPGALISAAISGDFMGTLDVLMPHVGASLNPMVGFDVVIVYNAMHIFYSDGIPGLVRYLAQTLTPPAVSLLLTAVLLGEDAPSILDNLLGLLDSGEFTMPLQAMMNDYTADQGPNATVAVRDQLVSIVTDVASGAIEKAQVTLDLVRTAPRSNSAATTQGALAIDAEAAWASDGPQGAVGVLTNGLMTGSPFARHFVRVITAGRPVLTWVQELAEALASGDLLDLLNALVGGVPNVPLIPQPPALVRTLVPIMVALVRGDFGAAAKALEPIVVRLPCHTMPCRTACYSPAGLMRQLPLLPLNCCIDQGPSIAPLLL